MNLATVIDNIIVTTPDKAKKALIPIAKLKDFINWRQKEFIEKYEGARHATENDTHSIIESHLKNGNALFAVINTDLLKWDRRASHPWILHMEIPYDGNENNGMPDSETLGLLDNIEKDVLQELRDFEGYLYIGRQSGKNLREIYFACKDFRKPSKVAHTIQKNYQAQFEITFDIYIDKYWNSFDRFKPAP